MFLGFYLIYCDYLGIIDFYKDDWFFFLFVDWLLLRFFCNKGIFFFEIGSMYLNVFLDFFEGLIFDSVR